MSAQNILVLAETHLGAVTDMTFELLGAARQLAAATGGEVLVLLVGSTELGSSLQAERVLVADQGQPAVYAPDATLALLERVLDRESPRVVLVGSTSSGLDLGPLLAARRNLPLVAGCKAVVVDGDRLRVAGSFCGGKMMAELEVTGSPAVLVLLPGCFPAAPRTGEGTVETIPWPAIAGHVQFEEMELPDSGDVDITREDVLLGIGRGIQQEDNLELVEELAEVLGGQLCASRPVVDQGWLPATRQIGKSGMVVKPKCYIALGISGAPEHVEGMADSDLIIAVNSDPDAPIFEAAPFGIVDDLLDVVPAITEAVKNRGEVEEGITKSK